MFIINNRRVSYYILTVSITLLSLQGLYSQQEIHSIKYKPLASNGKIIYLPIVPEHKVITADSISNDIEDDVAYNVYEDHWDNVRFNPYGNELLDFPLELHFKDENFAAPVNRKMVVTSRYGWRRGRPHRGIDIDLVVGDSVNTILDGKIRYIGYHGGHGKTVVVRHNNGLETVYAHLSKYLVEENQEVKKGQAIGIGGITGNSRGSHLHLEVKYRGKAIHPEYVFDFSPDTKVRAETVFITRKWAVARYHRSTRKSNIDLITSLEGLDKFKEDQKKVYTVKKGDTLYAIANRHGLPLSEICKMNAIRRNSVLKIGQQIILVNSEVQ